MAAIAGDIVMIAQRRRVCEQYTGAGLPVFSYRFDTPAVRANFTKNPSKFGRLMTPQYNAQPFSGSEHFVNVAFTFQNISGDLGPLPQFSNYTRLSENIGRAYISFANDHDPNTSKGRQSTLPYWPKYDLKKPSNMVWNSNRTYIEPDTFRKAGIDFLNEVSSDTQVLS
jgi:cholinesterase